jgi:stage II sporulation protein D
VRDAAALLLLAMLAVGCKPRRPTKATPQMDARSELWVRVLLLDDVTRCTLRCPSGFSVIVRDAGPGSQSARTRFDQTNKPLGIELREGRLTIGARDVMRTEGTIFTDDPYFFSLNGEDYRGNLTLVVNQDGGAFDVINLVPLESYLAGVVGAEMPNYWEPEALKAQAIAARTYCLYIKKRFGTDRAWDMKKTQAHQVYRGIAAESSQVWSAVNATEGQVLVCRQADSQEEIFPSYYSSTCGGHTEDSRNVFGDSFEPLTGVSCPYCAKVAKPRFFFWPMVRFDTAQVAEKLRQRYPKLKELGQITDIVPIEQSRYDGFSRLTKVKISGSSGRSDFLRAEDLRLSIDPSGRVLKSAVFEIAKLGDKWAFMAGRGYGHGVGMCQCGAQGLARKGASAERILAHYYPGSKIVSAY